MNPSLAEKIIDLGLGAGADFVDIFEEETREASVLFKDNKVESAKAGTDYGIGIRLVYGASVVYGFTSDESEAALIQLTQALAYQGQVGNISALPLSLTQAPVIQSVKIDPRTSGQGAKLDWLRRANTAARSYSPLIGQVMVSAVDSVSQIHILNSEGLNLSDIRTRCRFSVQVTAQDQGQLFVAREAPGALQGHEFFESLNIEQLSTDAAQRALLMLHAGYIEGKKMPVVMGNGFGGVIFHEACGHPLETEAIRRKASPFVGKLGEAIAHEKVTALDDGTLFNVWGSLGVDDEGTPTQKTVLIERGKLLNYLSDRVGAKELGLPQTGSARRESYKYAPVSRMRNTYIAAGTDALTDMLASVDQGLYAKKLGGGSVNPATGEFNFAVEEGYAIRSGKIAHPVRGATLIGKGHEILPLISMVGPDLELAAGMCGASSGMVPTTVGQPSLKVDSILVGGRA